MYTVCWNSLKPPEGNIDLGTNTKYCLSNVDRFCLNNANS